MDKYTQMINAFANQRNQEAGNLASYLQYYCRASLSPEELASVEHVLKRTYDLLLKVFKVTYHTTHDEYGKEHSLTRMVEVHTHQEAHNVVLYDMEKDYPHGEVTITEVED